MTPTELNAILNSIPFDLTFVDKDDTVRYFTQGRERIFDRNRAILGRKVQLCHPPHSVHIVQQILEDFRAGIQLCFGRPQLPVGPPLGPPLHLKRPLAEVRPH